MPLDTYVGATSDSHKVKSKGNALYQVALLVRLASILTVALGLMVLAGWTFNLPLLKSVLPGAVEMKANTAVGLVLAGCALFILDDRPSPPRQRSARRGDKEGKH